MSTNITHSVLEILSRGDPSPSPERIANRESIGLIMDRLYFSEFHIFEQLASGPAGERINIVGRKGPQTGAPLWLVAQTASGVQPVPARWQELDGRPVDARKASGRDAVVGFGSQSGKVDLMLKILAASRVPTRDLKRPLHIAALSGEEGLGSGAPLLLGPSEFGRGSALVHGPTQGALWARHPGCVILDFRVTRRSRHRRMPPHSGFWEITYETQSAHRLDPRPHDAPDAMAVLLESLDALRAPGDIRVLSVEVGEAANRRPARCHLRVATIYAEPPLLHSIHPKIRVRSIPDGAALPLPVDNLLEGWLTAHRAGLAAIAGRTGLARNAPDARPSLESATGRLVSDRDTISGQIMLWTGPGVETALLCETFAEAAQQALRGESELELELVVVQDRPAFDATDGADDLRRAASAAMRDADRDDALTGGVITTDAGLFRQHGLDTLVHGGAGPIERLYTDNESIDLDALHRASDFYERVIRAHCT